MLSILKTSSSVLGAACLLLAAASVPLHAAEPGRLIKVKLVCWIDDNGRRACGDVVPPRFAQKERKILDDKGRTRKILPAALTPEERAANEEREAEQARAKLAKEQQAARDRALLQTYARAGDLVALRDDRLATMDSRIQSARTAAGRDQKALFDLRTRLPEQGSKVKPAPKLLANIENFEQQVRDNDRAIAESLKARAEICSDFSRDIRRFQELKLGRVELVSPCPPLGSLGPKDSKKINLSAARKFFDRFTQLERSFDPAIISLYAPDAVVRERVVSAGGVVEQNDLNLKQFSQSIISQLAARREKQKTQTYSAIQVVESDAGRAKIYAIRSDSISKESAPFDMLIEPTTDGSWRIVEQGMQTMH